MEQLKEEFDKADEGWRKARDKHHLRGVSVDFQEKLRKVDVNLIV